MAKSIAIDADAHGLLVAVGSSARDKLAIDRLIAATDLTEPLTVSNAAQVGQRLKQLLKEAHVAPGPALVVVGRDRILLKDVKYPPVPASDEPNVVRFAAMKDVVEGADDVVFDYLPQPITEGERRATVAFVKKDVIAAVRQMCDAAGLKLSGVTPRPFAAVAALMQASSHGVVPPPDPVDGPVALVVVQEGGGEFTVCRNGVVVFTRTIPPAAVTSEESFFLELRRNLALASTQAGSDVQAIYVAEGDTQGEGWSGRLKATLGLPVYSFDPLAHVAAASQIPPELHGRFLGAVGLLVARGQSGPLPINFTQPRQPRRSNESSPQRQRALLYLLVGICSLAALGIGGWMMLDAAESKVRGLRMRIGQTEEEIRQREVDKKKLAALEEYTSREINWLDEYYEQTVRFPDITKVKMLQFEGTALPMPTDRDRAAEAAKGPPPKNAPPKPVAHLRMTLAAENGKLPGEMSDSIHNERKWYANSRMVAGAVIGGAGAGKLQQFIIEADLTRRPPLEYLRKLLVKLPEPVKPAAEKNKDSEPSKDESVRGGIDE